jgi:MFS family permease
MTTPHSLLRAGAARHLAVATVLDTIGTGVYFTVLPLFLIRSQGLEPNQIGLILTLASACGLIGGPLIGYIADRIALRPTLIVSYLFQFFGAAALPFCQNHTLITTVLCLNTFASEGGRAVRYAVIARLGGSNRVILRAKLRVMTNIGLSVGAALGGFVDQWDNRPVYVAALLINSASFAAAAAVQRLLPRMAALPLEASTVIDNQLEGFGALADPGYLLVAAINGILFLETRVLNLGVPLWIAVHDNLPRWTVSLSFLVNTLLVVALQVRLSRNIRTLNAVGQSWLRAGVMFLVSCTVISLSGALSTCWAVIVLTLAVALHTCGEIWHMAGSFEAALSLAPASAQGHYQGIFNLGEGISMTVGPMLVSVLCVDLGISGWLIIGIILACAGRLGSPAIQWVSRCPPHTRSSLARRRSGTLQADQSR